MSDRMIRTLFGKPDAETDQGSIKMTIPEGTFLRIYQWKEWDLSTPFRPSLKAGTVNCSRWSLVDLVDEMAQYLNHYAPGVYDFTRAKELLRAYQNDVVFEIGKPQGHKSMSANVTPLDELPEGGKWIAISVSKEE